MPDIVNAIETPDSGGRALVPRGAPIEAGGAADVLAALWRYKALIVTVFLATVVSALFWLWVRDDAYEVGAKILVRYSRDSVSPRSTVSSSTAQFMPAMRPDLATEADLLVSLSIIEQVVDDLGLDKPREKDPPEEFLRRVKFEIKEAVGTVKGWGNELLYMAGIKRRLTERESAIVAIAEALTVDFAPESSVMEAKFVTKYRDEAPIVLNALVDRYKERRQSVEYNPIEVEFFRDQVLEYQDKLREKERGLEDVKQRYGIYTDLAAQTDQALSHFMDAQASYQEAEAEWAAARARVQTIQEQIQTVQPVKTVAEVGERNELLDSLHGRRSDLLLQREQLAAKFQPGHAALLDVEQQLAKIDELIESTNPQVAKSRTTGVNPNHEQLELDLLQARQLLQALSALKASRQARVEQLDRELSALRTARLEYAERQRDVALEEMTYSFHERNLEEAIAAEAITATGATSIVVIDPAVVPIKPVGMRKAYIFGGAAGVGLILAFGLAFGLAALDDTVSDLAQVESLTGVPVVAAIGVDSEKRGSTEQLTRAAFELASIAGGNGSGRRPEAAALIGAHPGVGASSLAGSLKSAMSGRFGANTVLISFDEESRGLGETRITPLAGPPGSANGTRQLPSNVSENEVAELARQLTHGESPADMVLFDITAKPGESQTYAREAVRKSSAADYRLLVVEAGRTKLSTVAELAREFDRVGQPLQGVVVNKRKQELPGFLRSEG